MSASRWPLPNTVTTREAQVGLDIACSTLGHPVLTCDCVGCGDVRERLRAAFEALDNGRKQA